MADARMTNTVTRILVATDFSAASADALTLAKTLAERFDASLHLLHVLEDPYVTGAFAAEMYAPPPAGLRESWMKSAEASIDAQLTPQEKAAFNATTNVVFGPTAATIVERAAALGVDLIVMGTHGRGGVAHLLMGSVAERVVRTAKCPVLTTRGGAAAGNERAAA
ncbi:MAG TPA: universal stress protein [Vicinamibacterales bacterium]